MPRRPRLVDRGRQPGRLGPLHGRGDRRFLRPTTGDEPAVGIANWGTFAGAGCFAAAGVMQELERP